MLRVLSARVLRQISRRYSSAAVPLTSERYDVTRGNYASLGPEDVAYFRSFLGEHQVVEEPSELVGYNTDWLNMVRGKDELEKNEK